MITHPLALGIAVFFGLVTIAPKRPGFGESFKDYLAIACGAVIASAFTVFAV